MHGDDYIDGEHRNPDGSTRQRAPFCLGTIDATYPPHGCLMRTRHPSGYCAHHRTGDPYANPLDTSTGPVKTAPDSSHIDHTDRSL